MPYVRKAIVVSISNTLCGTETQLGNCPRLSLVSRTFFASTWFEDNQWPVAADAYGSLRLTMEVWSSSRAALIDSFSDRGGKLANRVGQDM